MTETLEQIVAPETERGHFMRTYTMRKFWPLDPREDDMDIEDVAHHLAMQVRFNGAVKDFYSVAEHCVIGSYLVPEEHAFEFLMHDAAEAWLGDLIRPMKHHSVLGNEYRRIERLVETQVKRKWGLLEETPAVIKQVDDALCALEIGSVYRHGTPIKPSEVGLPATTRLHFWPWQMAKLQFKARFADLRSGRKPQMKAVELVDPSDGGVLNVELMSETVRMADALESIVHQPRTEKGKGQE